MINKQHIRIGLALSGGGAKAGAHLGILKVFQEEGIKISRVVGVSSGSIIGAAYCLRKPIEDMMRFGEDVKKYKVLSLMNINFLGDSIFKSGKLERLIKDFLGNATFADCRIPFEVVCVDLESGDEILISDGPLWRALMASAAIPGLFSPRFVNNHYLADGGILNNMPVNQLRRHKDIDIVIGIDPGFRTNRQHLAGMIWDKYFKKPKGFNLGMGFIHSVKTNHSLMLTNILRAIDLTRQECQRARVDEAKPDLIITPDTEGVSVMEFEKYDTVIAAGEDAARQIMPELKKLISDMKQTHNAD